MTAFWDKWKISIWSIFESKPRTSPELAEQAQRILNGEGRNWDVDDYENANLRDPRLRDLHARTMHFGLPEEWVGLDVAKKSMLREIIEEMRQLESNSP